MEIQFEYMCLLLVSWCTYPVNETVVHQQAWKVLLDSKKPRHSLCLVFSTSTYAMLQSIAYLGHLSVENLL